MQPQQAMGKPVESPDPQAAPGISQQGLDAAAHFGGGLVGERDREDAVRRGALDLDEPCDAVHENPRFAASRPGEDQCRTERCCDRLSLSIIQTVE